MERRHSLADRGQVIVFLVLGTTLLGCISRASLGAEMPTAAIVVLELAGRVQTLRAGATTWDEASAGQVLYTGDRLRTHERSRVTLRWTDQSRVRLGELTEIEVLPPSVEKPSPPGFNLLGGLLYFFQRDRPTEVRFRTPNASAAIRGTEFDLRVSETGQTLLTVIDGEVDLGNAQGQVTLRNGEQAVVEPGQGPVRTAAIGVNNVIQWWLYYPAILNPDELPLAPPVQAALAESLAAYRRGDLLAALARYPPARQPETAAEQVYLAALLLSVGKVDAAQQSLSGPVSVGQDGSTARLAAALRHLMAVVRLQLGPPPAVTAPASALSSELLADSYDWQARADLTSALRSARAAVDKAPQFGFAWERLAELEFSFGRQAKARAALERSLQLAPRNAQALALRGFLLAARQNYPAALMSFDEALSVDAHLGNAWLGRGLGLIHLGKVEQGRGDLLTAATVEPQRALLRSYLGKAYAVEGDPERAARELSLAMRLDAQDPTAWLYLALLNQQENRINSAVRDLEHSQKLNDNRSLFRSRLLLDQDRAVRSANLANIYRDADMFDVSLREAARAINSDYANYSAHLFLANSYDQVRDPNFVNLRLETAANSEYLLANLLAPASGGIFNPAISQLEYSRLFERTGFGVVSRTEYLSRGDWIESGAQYGTFDTMSYALSAFYRSANGQRPNADVEQRQLLLQLKQELSARDRIYLEASQLDLAGGDLTQSYDNSVPFPELRTRERQEPVLNVGYQHEWSPGQHSLVLVGWIKDDFGYSNPRHPALLAIDSEGILRSVSAVPMGTQYRNELELFTVEPQHLWQTERNLLVLGGRFQSGRFHTQNLQANALGFERAFSDPAALQGFSNDLERWSFYAYDQWQFAPSLWLTAGLAYDRVTFPENFLAPPISDATSTEDQLSPKAGFIWAPAPGSTVRFAYARSLGGASLDQSVRIEPTQVAGFNQAFRSLIPESVAGSIPGARFDLYGLSLEQKLGSNTYLGLSAEWLNSEVDRTIGVFSSTAPPLPPPPGPGEPLPPPPPPPPPAVPAGFRQALEYTERSVRVSVDQLLGEEWSVGARYRLTQADLKMAFPAIPDSVPTSGLQARQNLDSLLHQVGLGVTFNHASSGLFSHVEANWYGQSNHGYNPGRPGDDFWQLDLFAGYRFWHRKAELRLGLLNVNDADYHLDPLTFYSELPRARTFTVRLQLNF